jgi:glycosyltransferase involved in cell wall biosynthesis
MGRALTEAALSGIPIVGYDYDWQREVIINNKTGYLVDHEDWLAMANAAEDLLNNKIKSKELGKNARKHIVKMMSPDILNSHEKKYYDTLLSNT